MVQSKQGASDCPSYHTPVYLDHAGVTEMSTADHAAIANASNFTFTLHSVKKHSDGYITHSLDLINSCFLLFC